MEVKRKGNMGEMTIVKRSIITAICIALCVVLPQMFHAIPNAGFVWLPMHIPVFLCGLICGWPFGLLCGLAGPLFSSLLFSMPIFAALPGMMVECGVYGCATGLLSQLAHTGRTYADLYVSLIGGMLAGRLAAGAAQALIFSSGSYSMAAWASGYFVTAFPGIVLQLAVIPSIVFALIKARLVPARYPGNRK